MYLFCWIILCEANDDVVWFSLASLVSPFLFFVVLVITEPCVVICYFETFGCFDSDIFDVIIWLLLTLNGLFWVKDD